MTTTQTPAQALIVKWAAKDAAAKNTWPGTPLTQLPLEMANDLQALRQAGLVKIVERPSKVNPERTASFVVIA